MARLVITHSTYAEGLIPWLKALACDGAIQTITPAVITRVRGRSPGLKLRVSAPLQSGHKLVARRGSTMQEVFVVTALSATELQTRIDACKPDPSAKGRALKR